MYKNIEEHCCVLFEAGMKGMGVTYHLSLLAIELNKIIPNYYVLHDNTEQQKGLINEITASNIKQFNYDEFSFEEILGRLKKAGYTKIIFHAQSWGGVRRISSLKKKYNVTIINGVNAYRNGKWYRRFVAKYLKLKYSRVIDSWVFFSHKAKEEFCKYADVSSKSWVIPWGIENFNFNLENQYLDIYRNQRENYEKDCFYIFYAAQFNYNKSHKELIKILKPILQNYNCKLILCGDGKLMDNMEKLTIKLNIREQVKFLGRIKRDVFLSHLKNANLSIVLSKNETFGHTIIEPLQIGVPVISTSVGIAPEAIFDFQNGFCIKRNEKNKILSLVESLISKRIKLTSSFNPQYSWVNTANLYSKLYSYIAEAS